MSGGDLAFVFFEGNICRREKFQIQQALQRKTQNKKPSIRWM
jgi:hypothetical protein